MEQTVAEGAKSIIDRAIKNRITDIHVEPLPNLITVRYRRAGQLYVASKLPKSAGELLAKHFKKMAALDEQTVNAPQIGNCEIKAGRRIFDLEVATMPVIDGEKVTLHLVERAAKLPNLAELGLWGPGLAALNHAMVQTSGLILVADSQPANLALSLGSMLQTIEMARPKAAYIGSEVLIPDFVQKFATSRAAVPESRRLRMLDRQNYEILTVENFKDQPSIEAALESAAKGKLVLGGVVAANAVAGLHLLKRAGQNHVLSANLRLAVGQAFFHRLCERCREPYEPSLFEQRQLDEFFSIGNKATMKKMHDLEKLAASSAEENLLSSSEHSIHRLWRPKLGGCKNCDHTGHKGAIGIFEVCEPGDNLRAAVSAGRSVENLRNAATEDGMIDLKTDGLVKALRGMIDMQTLLSVCMLSGSGKI